MPKPWEMEWSGGEMQTAAKPKPWEMDWSAPQQEATPPQQQEVGLMPALKRMATWPGRIAQTAGEAFMTGPNLMGDVATGKVDPNSPEAIGRSADTAMVFSPAAPARAGVMTAAKSVARPAGPAREALADAADAGYKALKEMDVPLSKEVVTDLSKGLKGSLNEESFYAEDQARTFRAIERLKNPVGEDSSAKEVYAARTALNHIVRDMPGTSEAAAASMAINRLDDYLSNVPGFAETAKNARGNYAALKRSELLEAKEERAGLEAGASGSGANEVNRMRAQAKNILLKPTDRAKFTAEEQDLLKEIASEGSKLSPANITRLLSKLGPSHPLSGWGTAVAGDFAGGHGTATASLAVGAISQWLSKKITTDKFHRLDEMTRARSPLGGPAPIAPRPQVVTPPAAAAAAVPGIDMLSPHQEQDSLRP
jgi:hypothetical protein